MIAGCSILPKKEGIGQDTSTAGSINESLEEPVNESVPPKDPVASSESISYENEQDTSQQVAVSGETALPEDEYYSFITAQENGPVELENSQLKYTAKEKNIAYKDMDGNRIIIALWPYFIHNDGEEIFMPANNAILDEYIISTINGFIEMTDEGAAEGMNGPFLLEINYRLEYTSNRLVSIMMHYFTYEGGAHPNTMNYSYNYGIEERNQILLYGGMFSDGYDFLDFLSVYCYEDICRQYTEAGMDLANVDSWIKDGTDPSEPENFENFYFTEDAFAVHFDQYEVGPYSMGPFTVNIPYEEFDGNLLYP